MSLDSKDLFDELGCVFSLLVYNDQKETKPYVTVRIDDLGFGLLFGPFISDLAIPLR